MAMAVSSRGGIRGIGQKITEYPQVDYWVQLMRKVDKTGATEHHKYHRYSDDKRELEKYGDMCRARTRVTTGWYTPPESTIQKVYARNCTKCGTLLPDDLSDARLVKTVWPFEADPIDFYACPECR